MTRPRDKQLEDEENAAASDVEKGSSKYPGMSYAEGVADTLRWVLGVEDAAPYTGGDE